ncbi:MAG TPA: Holliday junction resolvase RuvX [Chloroflexota bacterium]|nr:Holliday junction resolvase RuvX [Chloroflexota bacterium]
MAVDLGERRIGLALSDESEFLASPLATVASVGPRNDAEKIATIGAENKVELYVVGVPRRLDGSVGEQGEKCLAFAERLKKATEQAVRTWDESYSTAMAQDHMIGAGVRRRRRREQIDAMAAAVILQEFLDARSRRVSNTAIEPDPPDNNRDDSGE